LLSENLAEVTVKVHAIRADDFFRDSRKMAVPHQIIMPSNLSEPVVCLTKVIDLTFNSILSAY
jgi:hypothetical protein